MDHYVLPSPQGDVAVKINLDLVERLEKKGGSLFKIADQLVQKELPLSDILQLLLVAYASPDHERQSLADYILKQSPKPPAQILSEILLHILTPSQRMGAIQSGE